MRFILFCILGIFICTGVVISSANSGATPQIVPSSAVVIALVLFSAAILRPFFVVKPHIINRNNEQWHRFEVHRYTPHRGVDAVAYWTIFIVRGINAIKYLRLPYTLDITEKGLRVGVVHKRLDHFEDIVSLKIEKDLAIIELQDGKKYSVLFGKQAHCEEFARLVSDRIH